MYNDHYCINVLWYISRHSCPLDTPAGISIQHTLPHQAEQLIMPASQREYCISFWPQTSYRCLDPYPARPIGMVTMLAYTWLDESVSRYFCLLTCWFNWSGCDRSYARSMFYISSVLNITLLNKATLLCCIGLWRIDYWRNTSLDIVITVTLNFHFS